MSHALWDFYKETASLMSVSRKKGHRENEAASMMPVLLKPGLIMLACYGINTRAHNRRFFYKIGIILVAFSENLELALLRGGAP